MNTRYAGVGLGLRQPLVEDVLGAPTGVIDFVELAPENWLGMGGRFRAQLDAIAARYPLIAHGLSLSLGGPAPLDTRLLAQIKTLLETYGIEIYSEHLSYCGDEGHLYELFPIPYTDEAVRHISARIRTTQEILERRIAVENSSYYAVPAQTLSEVEFINAVLAEADCDLLLDVNNVYVNSVNHGYDASAFISALPAERVRYLHIAGHEREAADLLVDTHGAPVADPVWSLLALAYAHVGDRPTLLERDFNIPPFAALTQEVARIRERQSPGVRVSG